MSSGFLGFRKTLIGILGFFVFLAIVGMLKVAAAFIQPFVIATLLSFLLNPIVEAFHKIKIPRVVGILVVILILLGLSLVLGLVVTESVRSILSEFPLYQEKFTNLVNTVVTELNLPPNVLDQLELPMAAYNLAWNAAPGLLSFVGSAVLMLVFLIFIMLEKPYLRPKLLAAVKDEETTRIARIMASTNTQVGRYLKIKFFVSFLTATIVFVGFSLIGVDFAFLWAVLTFLFNFIPTIGSIVISLVAILFAYLQFAPDINPFIGAAVTMVGTQVVVGNFVDPKLTGDGLNLSPVVVLLALLMWGWLWGTIGLFLAVPLTVALKIIFDNVPSLHFLGTLMGTGQPPSQRTRRWGSGRKKGSLQADLAVPTQNHQDSEET